MRLDGAQWAGRDCRGDSLRGASLCGATLLGARLDDVDLREADLWGANLALASLRRADLRGARVSCASFAGADLRCARLAGADLRFADLAGAHLACVDWGQPRHHRRDTHAAYASAEGYPSFADAVGIAPVNVSWMRVTDVLFAVDAALEASTDTTAELRALLRSRDWRIIVVGAMAVARRGDASGLETELLGLLADNHQGAAAAVALLRAGHDPADLVARCPALAHGLVEDPHRREVRWCALVRKRLANVECWPDPDDRPPPASSW